MADMPGSLRDATVEALRRHAPYDRMDPVSLQFLISRLSLAYYPKGSRLVAPDQGAVQKLFIIQRGQVRGEIEGGVDDGDVVEYADGDTFPLAAIMAKRPVRHVYNAVEDCFCYEADADIVGTLVERSREFLAFCTSRVSALLQQSYAVLQAHYAQRSSGQHSLGVSLRDLVRREPLSCGPRQPLRAVLATMRAAGVGSIVIVDDASAPIGIFTERDLLRLAALEALDLSQPIEACMTPSPHCLPTRATAAEAAVLMVRCGIRHLIVVDEGRLAGVVSERDLFSLQRTSMRGIVQSLDHAHGTADFIQAAADIRELATNLLAQGVAAGSLVELIASLNDRLCCRILELEAPRHDLAGIKICWIALGSEGRLEQTFATDQDNALIFDSDSLPVDEARTRLVAFARAVNATLDACGFPLCKGGIMAGNPEWCLSGEEWRTTFGNWIRNPLPQALLNSTIFYDFRPLWGDASLAQTLRDWLSGELKGNERFLRAMSVNTMDTHIPIGIFSNFVTSGSGSERHTIDLKAEGTRPIVDAARILALASGVTQTNTAARLRQAGSRLRMPDAEISAMVDAFEFIQLLRLRHQHQHQHGEGIPGADNPNRIDPDSLNDLDRRILKEAFRQARKLQRRIALDYQL